MSDNTQIKVKNVVIRQEVIERINGRRDIKPLLAVILKLHRTSIFRLLRENTPNGHLTKMSSVDVISRLLGISPSEVLTEIEIQEPCAAV